MKALLMAALLAAASHAGAEQPHRHRAPIQLLQPGAFVQLELPPAAYAHSRQPGLSDLRVVDANGAIVPFSLLPPRPPVQRGADTLQPAALYPLPRRSAPGAAIGMPLQVEVQGDRVRIRPATGSTAPAPAADSPGWLIDLGERSNTEPAPHSLRLAWSGPAEFSASFDLDTSGTLRSWRPAGSGQVLALASTPAGTRPLVQRDVPLPAGTERFVRLVWRDTAGAPRLSSVQAVSNQPRSEDPDPPLRLVLQPAFTPASGTEPAALHVDLGGPLLPLRSLELQLPPGTQVLPVLVQGRSIASEPWSDITTGVFYRLQREGADSVPPPLPLIGSARYLRLVVDPRSSPPDPAQTRVVVQVAPLRLVYAAQGVAPHVLLAGSPDAAQGPLALTTLVPALEQERARFGRAQLGAWVEDTAAAQADQRRALQASLRPWLLWAVLLAGVGTLGFIVWRLAKAR